jgi:hypothetical protein
VASFQGKIWAVGGCDGWYPLNSVEVYDPATDTWCPFCETPFRQKKAFEQL